MTSSYRITALTGIVLAVIVVLGILVWSSYTTKAYTIPAWLVTRSVTAGQLISDDNVRLGRIGTAGEHIDLFSGDPRDHLAAHDLSVSDVIRPSDLIFGQLAAVPITLRYAPALHTGDHVDIYAALTSGGGQPDPATARLVLVGRNVMVGDATTTNGQATIEVPTGDEARWMALQSGNVLLLAAKSNGIGVQAMPLSGLTVADALSGLTGSSLPGGFLTNPASPSPTPTPHR